jgi:hypothetical protein
MRNEQGGRRRTEATKVDKEEENGGEWRRMEENGGKT